MGWWAAGHKSFYYYSVLLLVVVFCFCCFCFLLLTFFFGLFLLLIIVHYINTISNKSIHTYIYMCVCVCVCVCVCIIVPLSHTILLLHNRYIHCTRPPLSAGVGTLRSSAGWLSGMGFGPGLTFDLVNTTAAWTQGQLQQSSQGQLTQVWLPRPAALTACCPVSISCAALNACCPVYTDSMCAYFLRWWLHPVPPVLVESVQCSIPPSTCIFKPPCAVGGQHWPPKHNGGCSGGASQLHAHGQQYLAARYEASTPTHHHNHKTTTTNNTVPQVTTSQTYSSPWMACLPCWLLRASSPPSAAPPSRLRAP